jgi:8-oxo-dGTP diphosphatase
MVNLMTDVSVDCVVFGYHEDQLQVLLIEQKQPEGVSTAEKRFALPGDLVFENEDLDQAASRVLKELTSIEIEDAYLKQFFTFGNPARVKGLKDQEWLRSFRQNPEARVVTVAYYSLVKMEDYNPKASSFASETQWVNVNDIPELAFDHNTILNKALDAVRERIKYHPIGFHLLPKKFTLGQLQQLNEVILNEELDKRNFRRKVQKMESVVALNEKQTGVLHKPARLYSYIPE